MKGRFSRHAILGWQYFSFSSLNMSSHSFASSISDCQCFTVVLLYMENSFSLAPRVYLGFSTLWPECVLDVSFCFHFTRGKHWVCRLMFSIRFGKTSVKPTSIFSSSSFSPCFLRLFPCLLVCLMGPIAHFSSIFSLYFLHWFLLIHLQIYGFFILPYQTHCWTPSQFSISIIVVLNSRIYICFLFFCNL